MPTPFVSKRASVYADVPDEKWNDWRWQLSHRLNTAEDIEKVIPLTESERKALQKQDLFRVDVTPYFISLVDPERPERPRPQADHPHLGGVERLYRHDGRLAGRRSPLSGARACSPLPGPRAHARHHPMRVVLPLLHTLAHRR